MLGFLDEFLVLFGYPSGSGASLLAGTLPLRFFAESFACRMPTWRLPQSGRVPSLVASWGPARGGHGWGLILPVFNHSLCVVSVLMIVFAPRLV